jgi:hypothetical protein
MSKRERNYHLAGWGMFLVCAVFFIASAAASGDLLYLVGSIIFFAACIAFVIPLVTIKSRPVITNPDRDTEDRESATIV